MTIVSWEFESPSLHRCFFVCCGNSSVGRAQPCQGWGREFESRFPLCKWKELPSGDSFFFLSDIFHLHVPEYKAS